MNSGRPPYGNTPAWNQQGGQQNIPAGYAPRQPVNPGYAQPQAYGQQPAQTGYAQPTGYAAQPAYGQQPQQAGYAAQPQAYPAQQPYPPQPRQPAYPPRTGYAQPQIGYAQPQPGYAQTPPQPQQQAYTQPPQQAAYTRPQQTGQPRSQTYQQPYPPVYGQGQQTAPQMYVGYQPPRRKKIPPETIALMAVGGVLPVLFILGLVLPGAAWLKWVFIVLTVAGIGYVWARNAVQGSLKLTVSLIYGALAIVALVSALTGTSPADVTNQGNGGNSSNVTGQQTGGQNNQQGGGLPDSVLTWQDTQAPTEAPTPAQAITDGAARDQLTSFFHFWSANMIDEMVTLTSPSWRNAIKEPKTELFGILVNRTPTSYEITNMTGTDADTSRTATVRASIDKHYGNEEVYLFTVLMKKEDGIWYVDPKSLATNERESATPEAGNTTPTQPPLTTSFPGMTLYYNPNGGSYYHIDDHCPSAAASNLPFKGSFTWEQRYDEAYSKLTPCNRCGAPLRDE